MNAHDPYGVIDAFNTCSNLIPFHIETLERRGAPADALAGPTPARVSFAHFHDDNFDFADDHPVVEGEPVVVFLVLDPCGEPVDLVAWAWKSGRIASWLRRAFALGEGKIHAPRLSHHGALLVHRTPIGWLAAEQEGIVIVRPEVAAMRLECAGRLGAEDLAHRDELKQLLTRPAPCILVPVSALERAS